MRKQPPFRHPTDIRYDERIAALIGEHGHAGYGLYWLLIETLHREPDMRIYYSEHRIRRLSAALGVTSEEFKNFVGDLVYVYDLLTIEDDYLMSTITYRKPRKQKQPLEAPAETQHVDAPTDEVNNAKTQNTELATGKCNEHKIVEPHQGAERQQVCHDTDPGKRETPLQNGIASVSASMKKTISQYGSSKTAQRRHGITATTPQRHLNSSMYSSKNA